MISIKTVIVYAVLNNEIWMRKESYEKDTIITTNISCNNAVSGYELCREQCHL